MAELGSVAENGDIVLIDDKHIGKKKKAIYSS